MLLSRFGWLLLFFTFFLLFTFVFCLCPLLSWTLCTPKIHLAQLVVVCYFHMSINEDQQKKQSTERELRNNELRHRHRHTLWYLHSNLKTRNVNFNCIIFLDKKNNSMGIMENSRAKKNNIHTVEITVWAVIQPIIIIQSRKKSKIVRFLCDFTCNSMFIETWKKK